MQISSTAITGLSEFVRYCPTSKLTGYIELRYTPRKPRWDLLDNDTSDSMKDCINENFKNKSC